MLGVGYANARTFCKRLNSYGVTREEFDAALAALDDAPTDAAAATAAQGAASEPDALAAQQAGGAL